MKKLFLVFVIIFTCFALSLSVFSQTAKTNQYNGLLYKISGKNLKTPSYLYGTIHIICQNDMFGLEKLNGYIEQTDQILMELDMDNAAEMQSMAGKAAMPDGKTLKDFLTAKEYTKVDEMFKNYMGVSVENFKTYKPMFLSIMITTSPKSMGCDKSGSYELSLLQTAASKQKPIEGLETVALQFEKLDKQSFAEQAKELYKMAVNTQEKTTEFKEMVRIYKMQNSEALYKFINGKLGNQEFQKVLLDERNINWIAKIEKAVGEKSTFIAVGGGHLGGKTGVVNLLRKKGYKVEAIKL